ncbi:mitogen-activated protein kinase kinase kinase a [Anaeramoeba flamelloides]|uniref:Mitogen-activated protein kinase kinase kinase a n=1 Tax=Anaeramoeba flamelloides TaxID=1746091 RepID=A0ABQ8Y2Q7_9EUKA|nr:mitogen-activated protein kinase kinase kinase a [Anaeramoeba flamelloides]
MTSQKQILTVSRTPIPLRIRSRAKIGSRLRSEMKKEHLEAFNSFRDHDRKILEGLKNCKNKQRLEILNRYFTGLVVIEKNSLGKPTYVKISGRVLAAINVAFRGGSSSIRKSLSSHIKSFGLSAIKNSEKLYNCLPLEFTQHKNILPNQKKLRGVEQKKKKRRKSKIRIKLPIRTKKYEKKSDRRDQNKHTCLPTQKSTNTYTSTNRKQNRKKSLNIKQEMMNKNHNFLSQANFSQEVNRKRNLSLNNLSCNFIEKKRKYLKEGSYQNNKHDQFIQCNYQNKNSNMNKNVTNYKAKIKEQNKTKTKNEQKDNSNEQESSTNNEDRKENNKIKEKQSDNSDSETSHQQESKINQKQANENNVQTNISNSKSSQIISSDSEEESSSKEINKQDLTTTTTNNAPNTNTKNNDIQENNKSTNKDNKNENNNNNTNNIGKNKDNENMKTNKSIKTNHLTKIKNNHSQNDLNLSSFPSHPLVSGNKLNSNSTNNINLPFSTKNEIRWRKDALLGQGSFGKVHLGFNLDSGELIAVKQIPQSEHNPKEMDQLQQEVQLMAQLEHENIVKYLGTSKDEDFVNIFLEYIPGGSLSSLLSRFGGLEESVIQLYTRQILQGLKYLHNHSILHRDIKGANLLVDTDGSIKLADFGAAKKITGYSQPDETTSLTGTPFWMAPEVIKSNTYRKESDIWSLGCTVVEMLTAQHPWAEYNETVSVLFHIATCKAGPAYPTTISEECKDFLDLCFQIDPDDRPTTGILLKHPFVLKSQEIRSPKRLGNHQIRTKKIQFQRNRENSNLPERLSDKFQNSKLSDTELTFLKSRKNSRKLIQENFKETRNSNTSEIPFNSMQRKPINLNKIPKFQRRSKSLSRSQRVNSPPTKKKAINNKRINNSKNTRDKRERLNSGDFSRPEKKEFSMKKRKSRKEQFQSQIKEQSRNRSISLGPKKRVIKNNRNNSPRKYVNSKFDRNIQRIPPLKINNNNHNQPKKKKKKKMELKHNTNMNFPISYRQPRKERHSANKKYKTVGKGANNHKSFLNDPNFKANPMKKHKKSTMNNNFKNEKLNQKKGNKNANNQKINNNKKKTKRDALKSTSSLDNKTNSNSTCKRTMDYSSLRTKINKEKKMKKKTKNQLRNKNFKNKEIKTSSVNRTNSNNNNNNNKMNSKPKEIEILNTKSKNKPKKKKKQSVSVKHHEDDEIETLNKEIAGLRKRMKNREINLQSKSPPISNFNNYKSSSSYDINKNNYKIDQLISPRNIDNYPDFSKIQNNLHNPQSDIQKILEKAKVSTNSFKKMMNINEQYN